MTACLPLQEKIGSDWDKLYGHRENVVKKNKIVVKHLFAQKNPKYDIINS